MPFGIVCFSLQILYCPSPVSVYSFCTFVAALFLIIMKHLLPADGMDGLVMTCSPLSATLCNILGKLTIEDRTLRTFRRAMGFAQVVKKVCCPNFTLSVELIPGY